MNLTKVQLVSNQAIVDLPLVGVQQTDEYICTQIDGLGPPEVVHYTTDTPYQGTIYRGRRPQGREIVMRVALTPNYKLGKSPGDLRQQIYGLLAAGELDNPDIVEVRLYEGTSLWATTKGYIKKIEIVPFAKDPEVQIVLTCLNPYFVGQRVFVPPSAISGYAIKMTNPGFAPTGFHIEIKFITPVGNSMTGFILQPRNQVGGGTKKFQVTNPFTNDDKMILDTRPGYRSVVRDRGGTITNLLSAMPVSAIWPLLRGGDNFLEMPVSDQYQVTTAWFDPHYWGI